MYRDAGDERIMNRLPESQRQRIVERKLARGESDFRDLFMMGLSFDGKELENCDFSGAALAKISFVGSRLKNCVFDEADLSDSRFDLATIRECSFKGASVIGASFCGTEIDEPNVLTAADYYVQAILDREDKEAIGRKAIREGVSFSRESGENSDLINSEERWESWMGSDDCKKHRR
jgi:uncharacterized protein YjbI with pentapeptide repeats